MKARAEAVLADPQASPYSRQEATRALQMIDGLDRARAKAAQST